MQTTWLLAGALITGKMLGELSYEGLFVPTVDGAEHVLALPGATYRFRARRGAFETWHVEPGSATRDGEPACDPRQLVVDAREQLGLTGLRLADVLSEMTATVANEAARLAHAPTAAELVAMDYDHADGHLTGHPRLVLNKGRVGFSARDREEYAPEAGKAFALRWFAVHRDFASFRCVAELSEEQLLSEELGEQLSGFRAGLSDPDDYVLVPVHPWQADEIIGTLYAAEVAAGTVVPVGVSDDSYLPHQTVRTLANVTHPTRRDVKTAVSVRNTLVYRGLAQAATLAAPAVTTWLRSISAADPLLDKEYRFELLGEIASVSVKHPLLGHIDELPYRFHETLGALWREPLRTRVGAGERALSFAALPYRGPDGEAVITRLIRESGVNAEEWLGTWLDLFLTPLLHWLLRYGVGFCPHGQNLILITDERGLPVRVAIKDFAQGVDLMDEELPEYASLAPEANADMLRWAPHLLAQSLFSSVFAGQLRFLAEVLLDDLDYPRAALWTKVREIVRRYRDEHPESTARFDACLLFAPDVERVTLNREHFAGQGFDKIDRDDEFDVRFGRARNPLAAPDPDGAW
ncbi:siderophore synthetase component [Actinophytocola algeriensis]|uniref:Siderophore synthetase component n=2 Tax=Actinophytocola algeriensis TaxID=1768010 RepID=A0A7W7VH44_9PSEU|nr:siderophore synthetase component [Actinophytocola algeriensis]MBE1476008.1 siderophore synthetase component [Actinophytocola algeriensis]